ncbi:hypothetical protein B0H14DRAFT_2610032 [Mycena olivaceomarginata]|nr:hypothetical protein B0H14DRAFT_2610032 [Mycena olivaceomarginata]
MTQMVLIYILQGRQLAAIGGVNGRQGGVKNGFWERHSGGVSVTYWRHLGVKFIIATRHLLGLNFCKWFKTGGWAGTVHIVSIDRNILTSEKKLNHGWNMVGCIDQIWVCKFMLCNLWNNASYSQECRLKASFQINGELKSPGAALVCDVTELTPPKSAEGVNPGSKGASLGVTGAAVAALSPSPAGSCQAINAVYGPPARATSAAYHPRTRTKSSPSTERTPDPGQGKE